MRDIEGLCCSDRIRCSGNLWWSCRFNCYDVIVFIHSHDHVNSFDILFAWKNLYCWQTICFIFEWFLFAWYNWQSKRYSISTIITYPILIEIKVSDTRLTKALNMLNAMIRLTICLSFAALSNVLLIIVVVLVSIITFVSNARTMCA